MRPARRLRDRHRGAPAEFLIADCICPQGATEQAGQVIRKPINSLLVELVPVGLVSPKEARNSRQRAAIRLHSWTREQG